MSAWTTTPPAVEGWYWYKGYEGPEPSVTYVEKFGDSFWLGKNVGTDCVEEFDAEWFGPIYPPERSDDE